MVSMWEKCKKELKKRLNDHRFDIWIDPIYALSLKDGVLTLAVPNRYYIEKLTNEYLNLIQDVYTSLSKSGNSIDLVISPEQTGISASAQAEKTKSKTKSRDRSSKVSDAKQSPLQVKTVKKEEFSDNRLNPRYKFSNFIVGSCNQFAHAASKAVADNPGNAYNPLFIYGGVGLGKTHLMQAVGNLVMQKRPSHKVVYVTSETFINDLITSLQKGRMTHFRNKYRKIDVLIVDDIHFIAGKERSQEEFFHTFNTLFELKKQIVISSDKYPKEMPKLEERLRSRFEWGLIADIQQPEFETKVAILRQKSEEMSVDLPRDVADYIASKIKTNVRELEGCLSRLVAVSSLSGKRISMDLAEETFRDIFHSREKGIGITDIQKATCEFFGIKVSLIKSKKRDRSIAVPRHVAMYLCKELTHFSLSDIGKRFGGKDHSTVIHACRKIDKNIKEDHELLSSIKQIKRSLEV